jgi:hypothetical protein
MTFGEYWGRLPAWARRLTIASPVLGAFSLVAGIRGDALGFWAHWSFGANFFSSLTGALFGVPFAAILLTWFATSQEARTSQSQVAALSTNAWSEFKNSITNHLKILPAATLRTSTSEIFEAFELIRAKVDAAYQRNPKPGCIEAEFEWGDDSEGNGYDEDLRVIYGATQKIANGVKAIVARLGATGSLSDPYNRDWAAVRNKWEFLNTTVRDRRLGVGFDWGMPAAAESEFVYRLDTNQSPIHPVVSMIASQGVVAMKAITDAYEKRDKPAELAAGLSRGKVKQLDPANLKRLGEVGAKVLDELQSAIAAVDQAGWPINTQTP